MATIPIPPHSIGDDDLSDYSTGDGKPLAETPIHRDNLLDAVCVKGLNSCGGASAPMLRQPTSHKLGHQEYTARLNESGY